MNERGDTEPLSPAEERLLRLLALLRAEADVGEGTVRQAVMSHIRWQLLARTIGRAVAGLAGAVADGLALVFGLQPEREEKR